MRVSSTKRSIRLSLALLVFTILSIPAGLHSAGTRGYPLLIIGDGPFTFFESTCNPALSGFSFPVRLVKEEQELSGTAIVEVCVRANPGNDPNRLVNEADTRFVFEDGSRVSARVTTFGTVSAAAEEGFVYLELVGQGKVARARGLDARIGGNVRQDGFVYEQDCSVIECPGGLGAGFLPLEAMGITFLIETN